MTSPDPSTAEIHGATMWDQLSMIEGLEVETPEDLRTLLPNDQKHYVAALPGPLFKLKIAKVRSTGGTGIVFNGQHIAFDALSISLWAREVDSILSGGSLKCGIYKDFADAYFLHRNGPAAQAALRLPRTPFKWPWRGKRSTLAAPKSTRMVQGQRLGLVTSRRDLWEGRGASNSRRQRRVRVVRHYANDPNFFASHPTQSCRPYIPGRFREIGLRPNERLPDRRNRGAVLQCRGWTLVAFLGRLGPRRTGTDRSPVRHRGTHARARPKQNPYRLARARIQLLMSRTRRAETADQICSWPALYHHKRIPTDLDRGDGSILDAYFRRQSFNWLPNTKSGGDFGRLEQMQPESSADLGLQWNCGSVSEETLFVHAMLDDAQLRLREVQGAMDVFIKAVQWLTAPENWDKRVGEFEGLMKRGR